MKTGPLHGFTNLQQRIVSGIFLAAIVIALTFAGGFTFRFMCVVMGVAVYMEWRKLAGIGAHWSTRLSEIALSLAFATLLAGLSALFVFGLVGIAVVMALIVVVLGQATIWLPIGIAYAGISAASLAFLRGTDAQGFAAIVLLFAIVWSTDIFAYFVGRSLGGPKLSPNISPSKTWSGAIGGAAAAVAAGLTVVAAYGIYGFFVGSKYLPHLIVVVSVLSQSGDLFESWVKRRFNVKDSGSIIPGHGGVMDRVDGLVVAATALYLLVSIFEL